MSNTNQMHVDYIDGQSIVNAQVDVNRAVFEINKPGRKGQLSGEDPNINVDYVYKCITDAIKSLENVKAKLDGIIKIEFDE